MCFKVFLLNGTYVSVAWVIPFQEVFLWDPFVLIQMRCFLLSMSRTTSLTLNKLFGLANTMACLSLGNFHHLPPSSLCPFAFWPKTPRQSQLCSSETGCQLTW